MTGPETRENHGDTVEVIEVLAVSSHLSEGR